jgi:hypothetical protein
MAVEEAPEHGDREALAAILDQALVDLEQRDSLLRVERVVGRQR